MTLQICLQHARATEMTLAATGTDTGIRITLSDNGGGLSGDPAAALHTMRERARMLGAELQVDAAAPGMCVVLTLPAQGLTEATTATIDPV